ncbi:alpha/beta-hydrolase [Auriculariales sp. MPI-PUGE-AT-0066]|nr:alpha/beta-hydrolase [Auriculariales sp. MPI-PUGE-AT-0066]
MRSASLTLYAATALAASSSFRQHAPFRVDMWHKQEAVSPLGTQFKVVSPASNPLGGTLRYVENSGVCETTPGVYQASGYADLDANRSMWFWFFESRNSPETAPLSIWLNGGPGSSSMIGLFQEHGPCRISNDSKTVSLNPYSWNENSNIIYIDQPVGVGFSHGTLAVSGSLAAAKAVYQLLQIFFNDPTFSKYQTSDFALWTESYGGHYGPAFSHYFEQQNAIVDAGQGNGLLKLNLKTLGIGNGLTDPLSQYPQYINYALNNGYVQTASTATIQSANTSLYASGGCLQQIQNCYNTGAASTCSSAQSYCNSRVLSPPAGSRNVYDVRTTSSAYPPDFTNYLRNSTIMQLIGAEVNWTQTNTQVYSQFAATGDWMLNSALDLAPVVDSGVRTLVFAGDADYICNAFGVEAMMKNLPSKFQADYNAQSFTNWTVDGVLTGWYVNTGTLSYLRVKDAGHEVPAYGTTGLDIGQASLVFYEQAMKGLPISST